MTDVIIQPGDSGLDVDGTFCYDLKYVLNSIETPSGNYSFVVSGRTSFEFTGSEPLADCNSSGSDEVHLHYLIKDGTPHESGQRGGGEFSFSCLGNGGGCTYKVHGHYANGQLQFNRAEVDCTPSS